MRKRQGPAPTPPPQELGVGTAADNSYKQSKLDGGVAMTTKPLPAIQEMCNWFIYIVPKPNRPVSVGLGALL